MSKKKAKIQQPVPFSYGKFIIPLLILLSFLLYGNTLNHSYTFDDDIYTAKNSVVTAGFGRMAEVFTKGSVYGFNGENSGTYRPVSLFSFALENALFGLNPVVSHWINVILYALSVCLFFMVLRQWVSDKGLLLPFLATLIFLLHPVHTEVVASVKSREEILAFLFGFASLYFLWKHLQSGKKAWLAVSWIGFFLACLSKENAITLLAVVPLALYVFPVGPALKGKRILQLSAGFFVAATLYLLLRLAVLQEPSALPVDPFINNSLLKAGNYFDSLPSNFIILGKYLGLLFFPLRLSYDYSFNQIPLSGWGNPLFWASLLAYLAIAGFAILKIRSRSLLAFCILFFLATLSVTSQLFVRIEATMAERFLFLPSAGFALALGYLFSLPERVPRLQPFRIPLLLVAGLLCVVFGFRTLNRNPVWNNNHILFESGIKTAPNSFRTHLNLAEWQRFEAEQSRDQSKRNRLFTQAAAHYQKSLSIYAGEAQSWYHLGICLYGFGKAEEAFSAYTETLKRNPKHAQAANNLGVILFQQGDYEKALSYFRMAAESEPGFADAYANIGAVYQNRGQLGEAIQQYELSLKYKSGNPNVFNNLARIYRQLGDEKKAAFYQQKAGSGNQP